MAVKQERASSQSINYLIKLLSRKKMFSYLPIAVERTVVVVVAVTRQVTVEVLGWQLKKRRLRPVDDFDRFAAIKTKQKHISKQDKTTKNTGL